MFILKSKLLKITFNFFPYTSIVFPFTMQTHGILKPSGHSLTLSAVDCGAITAQVIKKAILGLCGTWQGFHSEIRSEMKSELSRANKTSPVS